MTVPGGRHDGETGRSGFPLGGDGDGGGLGCLRRAKLAAHRWSGRVANPSELIQWAAPRLVEPLRSPLVELLVRTETFLVVVFHLTFLDHPYQFDAGEGCLSHIERFETHHRPRHPLFASVVLFNNGDRRAVFSVIPADGCCISAALVDVDFFGQALRPMALVKMHLAAF